MNVYPLYGPRLKISRAESEIERLRRQEDAFRQDSPYTVVKSEFNPQSEKDVYRIRANGLPPSLDPWSIYIGEIAHNLRSALNYLIYQLALLHTKSETVAECKKLQFPIFGHEVDFRNKSKGMISLLKPEHKALVEGLQPFQGAINHPLFWLEEINNADKHRLIQVVAVKMGAGPFASYWDHIDNPILHESNVILEDGAKLMEASPQVHVNKKIVPLIAFLQGCKTVEGQGVVDIFTKISIRVSEVIESFDSVF
jgi:hypothetical protein